MSGDYSTWIYCQMCLEIICATSILGVYQATSLSKTPIPRKLFFIKIVDSGGKNTMPRTAITLCDLASYIIWSILSTYLNIN